MQNNSSVVAGLDVRTVAGANRALDTIDSALATIDSQRGLLGATQNRLEAVVGSVRGAADDLSAARSRIVDADYGVEIGELTRANILQQAGLAMVAQANTHWKDVLRLIR